MLFKNFKSYAENKLIPSSDVLIFEDCPLTFHLCVSTSTGHPLLNFYLSTNADCLLNYKFYTRLNGIERLIWCVQEFPEGNMPKGPPRVIPIYRFSIPSFDLQCRLDITVRRSNVGQKVSTISTEVSQLLFDETTSDVRVTVGESEASYPAHKFILALRSEVFKTMFKNGMHEALSGEVVLPNASGCCVEAFLRYLYTDTCTDETLQTSNNELLVLAHQYQVMGLVSLCSSYAITALTCENAVTTLLLADTYELSHLKSVCIEFIARHKAGVFTSVDVVNTLGSELVLQILLCM